jgi:hypothetical protein
VSENAFPAGLAAELAAFIDARIAEALKGLQKAKPQPFRLLTLPEAADRLRRSRSWLYHHHRRLRLGRRDGGRLMFREADVERYLRAVERKGMS